MFELTDEALLKLGEAWVDLIKAGLRQKYPYGNPNVKGSANKIASGTLYESLRVELQPTPDGAFLNFFAATAPGDDNTYLDYVDRGRPKGITKVPVQALLDWIEIKGIRPRNKKGQFILNNLQNRTSLAFAIRENIFKYGIRPTNIYENSYDDIADLINQPPSEIADEVNELFAAVQQDIENFITRIIFNPTT